MILFKVVKIDGDGPIILLGDGARQQSVPGRIREPLTDTDTGNRATVQPYDLASDLGEANNLAQANPQKVREVEGLLKTAARNQ